MRVLGLGSGGGLRQWLAAIGLCVLAHAATAQDIVPPPAVAIIIDDLGNQHDSGQRVVALPGALTCAFLPETPYAARQAEAAYASGKEVMLHMPMQSVEDRPLGPDALSLDMTQAEFLRTLARALASIPHVRGINNHMGSLLTRHPGHMDWLMQAMAAGPDLFFVDSRTTAQTVAYRMAEERRLPYIERDVFLDSETGSTEYVRKQFARLLARAHAQGFALAIGHPYPETLVVLEAELPRLAAEGIRLVPVSELIGIKEQRQLWQASLSPSRPAAKN